MPAFRQALKDGATHLEMDVHRTRDGHIVVAHDADGGRMAGEGAPLRDLTLAEIQEWNVGARFTRHPDAVGPKLYRANRSYTAPSLEEILATFPGVPLNVDIKQHEKDVVRDVVDLLRKHGAAERTLLASFDSTILRYVRSLRYEGPTGVTLTDLGRLLLLPRFLLGRWADNGEAVQVPRRSYKGPIRWRMDSARFIRKAQSLGVRVEYWVVNNPAEALLLLERGADGIMTDDPAAIAPTFYDFAERRGRAIDRRG